MSRLYLHLMLILFVVFTVVTMLIHAQAYDDHELRQLLLPDGCSAPCLLGIQAGVTTTDEAVQILNSSGWVDQIIRGDTAIIWTWNGQQPVFIDETQTAHMLLSVSVTGHAVIQEISVPTRMAIGSIMLVMPEPQSFMLMAEGQADGTRTNYVYLRYSDIKVQGALSCPNRIHNLVHQSAILIFYNPYNANFDFEEQFWEKGQLVSFATDQNICNP